MFSVCRDLSGHHKWLIRAHLGTISFFSSLRKRRIPSKMIAAVTVLALMSLLVATDSEPTGTSVPTSVPKPLRPGKRAAEKQLPAADRVAA